MHKIDKQKSIMVKNLNQSILINKAVDMYAKEILKYTPQLFTKQTNATENIIPEANGSGVLIEVKNQKFLITAGHILASTIPENIGIMIDDTFYILNGIVEYINPNESDVANKIDIAVWKLDEEVVKNLSIKYSFFQYEDIEFNHKVSTEPRYLIVGFPWRNTVRKKGSQSLTVSPLVFLTEISNKKLYKTLKFDQRTNILLDYRQKKVKNIKDGMVQTHKSPQGISGCGVWYLPEFFIEGNPKPKLVGQIIEQDKYKTILISTRIHLAMEILRTKFKIDIPASYITRLKNE